MTTTTDVNLPHAEWGTYKPGGRMEIEPFGWDPHSQEGWGPSLIAVWESRYALVQRAYPSPHPMTWRSEAMTYEQALDRKHALRIAEAPDLYEALSYVPDVTMLAFAEHHGPYGCEENTSLKDCPTHQCVHSALATIKDVLANRNRIEYTLRLVQERFPDESGD